jgi:hypothetical protein
MITLHTTKLAAILVFAMLLAGGCRPMPGKPTLPPTTGQPPIEATGAPVRSPAQTMPLPAPTANAGAPALMAEPTPDAARHPTLADLWEGRAHFAVDVAETGLPMGESDTLVMSNGALWSYVHASDRSAGVRDQCGAPVAFPGCVVIYASEDGGHTFTLPDPPTCLIECAQCPCDADVDHTVQQQYPRVVVAEGRAWMVYEYLGRVMLRTSRDGRLWSAPAHVADSLVWHLWYRDCPAEERIGKHPFTPFDYECLRGGPPGVFVEDGTVYVFMAQGQNPGAMGCFKRAVDDDNAAFQPCANNPLFVGAAAYGSHDRTDAVANPFFDFRTISSAEIQRLGEGAERRYYLLYEGVRGPAQGDPGDTQFGLGLARSLSDQIDGAWEKFPANPLLVDLPGNIGLGHADLVVLDGRTYLYTSLDGVTRSRLVLIWDEPAR